MAQYQFITYAGAKTALAQRLADPARVFWTDAEIGLYLKEALRTWNSLTEFWVADYAFTPNLNHWYDLSVLPGSPRLRTVTDTEIYTMMQYQLLEPPTGGTWTGTSQFTIADLSGALQRRRDEMVQVSGCNIAQLGPLPSLPNTRRTTFPDSTLEPRRARFMPDSGLPNTMTREDGYAWNQFEADHQQTPRIPQAWGVISGPPLAMDVDTAPNVAGRYDVLALMAGKSFNPPAATLMGVPNDWTWIAKWGALSDLLARESEATDRQRAKYCLGRYQDGLKIMKQSNWLLSGTINGIPVDTPSVDEMDAYSTEWESSANPWPSLVTAGMDFLAPCPLGSPPRGVSLVLVGNAPVPNVDADFLQVSQDVFDAILDYAQWLANFKMGGEDWQGSQDLERNFFTVALQTNTRLSKLGLFSDMLHWEGKRQDSNQPR